MRRAGGSRSVCGARRAARDRPACWRSPAPTPASAALAHVVHPGESLWSIAAANNLTTRTVAVYNGLAEDAVLIVGQTIQVPTVDEGAAALANAGITPGPLEHRPPTSTGAHTSSRRARACGRSRGERTQRLDPGRRQRARRGRDTLHRRHAPGPTPPRPAPARRTTYGLATSLALRRPPPRPRPPPPPGTRCARRRWPHYGVDLYPDGPVSAYRTYDQQSYLYNLYLSGQGAPANPPGTLDPRARDRRRRRRRVDAQRHRPDRRAPTAGRRRSPSEWWHVQYVGCQPLPCELMVSRRRRRRRGP